MKQDELNLFEAGAALPEGLVYQADIVSAAEELKLVQRVRELPLKEFHFHGYVGKRRVISYGWQYDFSERGAQEDRRHSVVAPGSVRRWCSNRHGVRCVISPRGSAAAS